LENVRRPELRPGGEVVVLMRSVFMYALLRKKLVQALENKRKPQADK